jgi:hypothetical protein
LQSSPNFNRSLHRSRLNQAHIPIEATGALPLGSGVAPAPLRNRASGLRGFRIGEDGTAQVDDGVDREAATGGNGARGVKIEFVGDDGRPQTLYYFSVNVDNDGFRASGFAGFCERLGTGDAFVKSASYLMHRANFSDVRSFLLEHTRLILQDDSGIPVNRFDQASWRLRPFGHYSGPIALFANRYQPKLTQLFNQRPVESIDFGIGYRWHPQNSSLIVATRTDAATAGAATGEQSEVVPDKSTTAIGTDRKTHRTASRHARNRSSVRTRRLVGPAQRSFWFADW